jgi:hypothetical protein
MFHYRDAKKFTSHHRKSVENVEPRGVGVRIARRKRHTLRGWRSLRRRMSLLLATGFTPR